MPNLGPTELLILAVVCLIPFGIAFGVLGLVKQGTRRAPTQQEA